MSIEKVSLTLEASRPRTRTCGFSRCEAPSESQGSSLVGAYPASSSLRVLTRGDRRSSMMLHTTSFSTTS